MDISEVAQRSGLPASALRFYEEKGLIASVGRRGLRRVFAPDVLERLALIALGRSAGFSLNEIAQMFAPGGQGRRARQDHPQIECHARRPAARGCMSSAEPYGMSEISPTVGNCRVGRKQEPRRENRIEEPAAKQFSTR
jgi:DNA-binding transcriptional MerR regulator